MIQVSLFLTRFRMFPLTVTLLTVTLMEATANRAEWKRNIPSHLSPI
jgi:hypothetical protein